MSFQPEAETHDSHSSGGNHDDTLQAKLRDMVDRMITTSPSCVQQQDATQSGSDDEPGFRLFSHSAPSKHIALDDEDDSKRIRKHNLAARRLQQRKRRRCNSDDKNTRNDKPSAATSSDSDSDSENERLKEASIDGFTVLAGSAIPKATAGSDGATSEKYASGDKTGTVPAAKKKKKKRKNKSESAAVVNINAGNCADGSKCDGAASNKTSNEVVGVVNEAAAGENGSPAKKKKRKKKKKANVAPNPSEDPSENVAPVNGEKPGDVPESTANNCDGNEKCDTVTHASADGSGVMREVGTSENRSSVKKKKRKKSGECVENNTTVVPTSRSLAHMSSDKSSSVGSGMLVHENGPPAKKRKHKDKLKVSKTDASNKTCAKTPSLSNRKMDSGASDARTSENELQPAKKNKRKKKTAKSAAATNIASDGARGRKKQRETERDSVGNGACDSENEATVRKKRKKKKKNNE